MAAFESGDRSPGQQDVSLGVLPQSHIYGLIMCLLSAYRGESVVVLPKFTLEAMAKAIQTFGINVLIIVSSTIAR
jgi:long-subunit acyl-CoA synthetase (AMP-forming)